MIRNIVPKFLLRMSDSSTCEITAPEAMRLRGERFLGYATMLFRISKNIAVKGTFFFLVSAVILALSSVFHPFDVLKTRVDAFGLILVPLIILCGSIDGTAFSRRDFLFGVVFAAFLVAPEFLMTDRGQWATYRESLKYLSYISGGLTCFFSCFVVPEKETHDENIVFSFPSSMRVFLMDAEKPSVVDMENTEEDVLDV